MTTTSPPSDEQTPAEPEAIDHMTTSAAVVTIFLLRGPQNPSRMSCSAGTRCRTGGLAN